jgi:hypothetical protein
MPLRHDDQHPRRHLERLRPTGRHYGEGRGALQNVHKLITILMAFPWAVSGETSRKDATVTEPRWRMPPRFRLR